MKRKRYFQWLDGEQKGDVVMLESISTFEGETYYNFDDGESCNVRFISKMTSNVVDLREKFMVEVESPSNIWTFEAIDTRIPFGINGAGPEDTIPTLHDFTHSDATGGASSANIANSNFGKEKLVPPKRPQRLCPLPDPKEYEEDTHVNEIQQPQTKQKVEFVVRSADEIVEDKKDAPKEETKKETGTDPIAILVDSCKKHSTEIPITLKIDLPMKSLYNIALNEFENGGKKFIDYIVKGIDTKTIIDALRVSLAIGYSEHGELTDTSETN